MEIGVITLTQHVLRINGNLYLTDCFSPSEKGLLATLEEIGSTMCAYCEPGGAIEGDIYMTFNKLRDYPNTQIEVTGNVTII